MVTIPSLRPEHETLLLEVAKRYKDKVSFWEFVAIALLAGVKEIDAGGFRHPDKGGCYTYEASEEVIGGMRAVALHTERG